ncbi:TetR/AcrR family transcriptional regulator [Streptomyces malaysiensis]|uniref:TetR/AcrR family transcriptional regulator n=1 Tax=Streptomyces malaysiensis TaxID=92644 RepID=UPI002B2E940F|nr:TetR/AcrR family transcriptional regulator [Streptomyces malaysiensis]
MSARRSTGARSAKRQRQISDAAAKLFRAKGYANTSMQDLADEVGILKPSLYYHIHSKEDLLYEIFAEIHEDVQNIITEIEARDDLDGAAKLRLWARLHVRHAITHQEKIAVFFQEVGSLSPERMAPIMVMRQAYERFVLSLIQSEQLRGEIDPALDAKQLSLLAFGVLNWMHTWYQPRGAAGDERLADLCADFIVGGLQSLATQGEKRLAP